MEFICLLCILSYFGIDFFVQGAPTYNSKDLDVDAYETCGAMIAWKRVRHGPVSNAIFALRASSANGETHRHSSSGKVWKGRPFQNFQLEILERTSFPNLARGGMAEYLQHYGFFDDHGGKTARLDLYSSRQKALRLYQKYYGLKTTGTLDDATFNLMTSSRCGVPDNPEILDVYEDDIMSGNSSQLKPLAYKLSGPKWKKKTIKWGISKYTSQLPNAAQRKTLGDALNRWQHVSGLTFIYTEGKADIDIQFVRRDHGDGSAFDGPSNSRKGNVLAHAFPPGSGGLSGDAHFDNDEKWTVDVSNKIWERKYLERVAAHEFGHSLGLQHSGIEGALMNAYYSSSKATYELTHDDMNAIQHLYGKPEGWVPTLGGYVPTLPPPVPSCNNLFKAVIWGSDQKAYGIFMDQVYSINDGRQSRERPKLLQEVFPGAPVEVDFAFTMNKISRSRTTTTVTYMFMERSVWRFTSYSLDPGYPKPLYVENLPEPPTAVIATTEEGRETIFMIGKTKWWIWDETIQENPNRMVGQVFKGYWSHIPSNYPLVTTWIDGDVYLIANNNHVRMKARNARDGYPKQGVPDWVYQSCPGTATYLKNSLASMLLVLLTTVMFS